MNRTILGTVAILLCLAYAGTAQAQINVVKKPAPAAGPDEYVVYDSWTSHWGVRDDPPDKYPLGLRTHETEAEAVAAAKAHMARTAGNGDLSVTHYLIEGEASVRSKKGPSLPSGDRLQNDAIASLNKDTRNSLNKLLKKAVDDAFTKKTRDIKKVWETVKEGKEYLYRNVSKLTEDDFKKVNGLVKEYNSKVDKYASEEPNPQYFAALPRATPVNAGDLKRQFDKWKSAQDSRDALKKQKEALDKERSRLEKERADLIREGSSNDAEADQLAALERTNADEDGAPIKGPFILYMGQYSNTRGSKHGEYKSFLEARAEGEKHMKENASKQPNYRITDSSSNDIEYDGLFSRKKVSQQQIERSTAKKPESTDKNSTANLAKRKDAVAMRQQNRQSRVDQYKSDFAKYNEQLAAYETAAGKHHAGVGNLGDEGYQPPASPQP